MQAPANVDLGAKDRVSPSLGARLQKHFMNNRAAYATALGATLAAAGAGVAASRNRAGLERAGAHAHGAVLGALSRHVGRLGRPRSL